MFFRKCVFISLIWGYLLLVDMKGKKNVRFILKIKLINIKKPVIA